MRAASLLVVSLTALVPRPGPAAEPIAGRGELHAADAALDDTGAKLDTRLRAADGAAPATAAETASWRRGGRVRITLRLDRLDDRRRAALRAAGLEIERDEARHGLVEGWARAARVRALAALPEVRSVRPVDRGHVRAGRVVTAGDAAARADLARALGVSGAGVRVGVISDGIDGLATSQASGDLPAVTVPPGCSSGGGSEGRAMLEIVHDLAPGAELLFASGIDSQLAFIGAVRCLRAAGAQVIVDDLGFFGEPYFEDGPIAEAVREAVRAGVSYHTAAGNSALSHYRAPFRPARDPTLHDFDAGPGIDDTNAIAVPAGDSLLCVLQWDNPFGAAADDYDLLLVDRSRRVLRASNNRQRGTGDPLEIVSFANNGPDRQVVGLVVERRRGAARTLKLFCVRGADGMEHVTPGASIFGHGGIPEAIAVAAINVADPGLDTIERFSSRGPVEIAFPQPEVRAKPDLAAFDGVTTSVPAFAPFFGTSAAAPHTAAVAALMLERNPHLTPADVQALLAATAVDIGPAGFDDAAGAGRLDALAALEAVPMPECAADADCPGADPCARVRCVRGLCIPEPVSCDDGNPCNGTERCDAETGLCLPGPPAPDGTPCPDETVCNGDERCLDGACQPGIPLQCSDGDTCTTDLCSPDLGCQFPVLEGVAWVRCLLDRGLPICPGVELPASIARRFTRAQRLVVRSQQARRARAQRLHLARAARILRRAVGIVERTGQRLPAECASALAGSLAEAQSRARAAAQSLR